MSKKSDTPTLEATLAVQEYRELEKEFVANDARPRSIPAEGIGTELMFHRWTPEQVLTIHNRLVDAGHTSNTIDASNDAFRGHAIKIIQIGLYDGRKLAYPGQDGFNQIARLDNATISLLASEALSFNEVF